jgi:hypothetical protein
MSTVRIQVRRGTAADWTSVNPVLAAGEMGVESDTNLFKFGNGSTAWTALSYANRNNAEVTEIAQDAIDAALSLGAGLTKTYNDGANTITIAVDSDVIALKSYVDSQLTGLSNTVDVTYIQISDRGAPNGVASLDSNGYVPSGQIDSNVWASKTHLASVASGLVLKAASKVATTENLAATYAAGTADASGGNGVGATLTLNANGALSIDGVALASGDRVLVKDQTTGSQNGLYVVTNAGSAGAAAVLTRATDADNSEDGEVKEGLFTFIAEGTTHQRNGFVLLADASRPGEIFQLGTDTLTFSQFTGAVPVNVGFGITKNGTVLEVDTASVASISYVQSEISGVNTNLTALDSTVSDISTNLTAAEANIVTLQSSASAASTAIGALQGADTAFDGRISDNEAAIADHETRVAAIEGQTLDTRLTAAEGDIDALQSGATALDGRINTLETDAASYETIYAHIDEPTFTGDVTLPSTTTIGLVTSTEILSLSGVTSAIQGQIDSKANSSDVSTHVNATTGVHGIADTAELETQTGAQAKADNAQSAAISAAASDATTKANTAESNAVDTAATAAAALYATIVDTEMTGDATAENLTLTGNLVVNGTTTTVNATDLTVSDPLIYIGEGNTTNTVDLGFVASFNDGTYQHSGLAKDATDGVWKLFKGVTDEPTTTINFAQASYETLKLDGVAFSDGTQTKQGVPSQTTITSKTADYTLSALTERDSMIEVNSSSAVTITVPPNSSVAYPVGTSIDLLRVGSGSVTVSAGSGVTLNYTPGNKLRAQWSSATLFKRATDSWVLVGDLSA